MDRSWPQASSRRMPRDGAQQQRTGRSFATLHGTARAQGVLRAMPQGCRAA
jgi:hypothetical protein